MKRFTDRSSDARVSVGAGSRVSVGLLDCYVRTTPLWGGESLTRFNRSCRGAMTTTNIRDVALRAGVSIATVSNVLNHPDVVAPGTRGRVLEAIAELGYIRNDSARQLRAGRS